MRHLTRDEIAILYSHGCDAADWKGVEVADNFSPQRVRRVTFGGRVKLGLLDGVLNVDGVQISSALEDATLIDVEVEDGCLVKNVGLISNYKIERGAVVMNCGTVTCDVDTDFAIGTKIAVVNEAGGQEVPLSQGLSSNVAYIVAFHPKRAEMLSAFDKMIEHERAEIRGKGVIAESAQVIGCQRIKNVRIGRAARVERAVDLTCGVVLSAPEQPTVISNGVVARQFIAAEGAQVTNNAVLKRCYIGQCAQIGDGFMAENVLAFAGCQLLNGEAVAVLAGPFTVSHHKTTLLIAAAYSFFNAGSATNASNHHYRLGPMHQSFFERGVKTGSGSYVLHPAKIGAFTMVVGHHKSHADTRKFPFSTLAERDGESYLMPAQNLRTIGIFRDEEKWLGRDVRRENLRRDQLSAEVMSPLMIERFIQAQAEIERLLTTDADTLLYQGVRIKKGLLPRAAKAYAQMTEGVVKANFLANLERIRTENYVAKTDYVDWQDVGGMLLPGKDVDGVVEQICSDKFFNINDLASAFELLSKSHAERRLDFYLSKAKTLYDLDAHSHDAQIVAAAKDVERIFTEVQKAVLADAEKDFAFAARTAATDACTSRCRAYYDKIIEQAKTIILKFERE